MYNKPPTVVGLIGPINGGKSAVTNSLAKDLVSMMGLFQTTIIPEITGEQLPRALQELDPTTFIFNEYKIKTDDNDDIICIELPGVFCGDACDGLPFDHTLYTKAIDTYLQHMDIVYWVTDIKTAFITAHELNEFNAIKKSLSKTSTKLVIMLSKYEYDDPSNANATNNDNPSSTNTNANANDDDTISCNTSGSIFDSSISLAEEIAIDNRYKQLTEMNDLKDHIFIKFNPLGRLKNSSTVNTEFRLPYRPIDIMKTKQDKLADSIIDLLNFITVHDTTSIITQMDLLTDTDAIEKIFKKITKPSDILYVDHLCLMYFIRNKNRVFANIGDDLVYDAMSESVHMRMALLVGLDTISGLRMYYSYCFTAKYIDQIGLHKRDGVEKITSDISPHVKFYRYITTIPDIQEGRLNLLEQYVTYDETPRSRSLCKKSVINTIEKLTEDLWGADNDRDVRMIIAYNLYHPAVSMFLTM